MVRKTLLYPILFWLLPLAGQGGFPSQTHNFGDVAFWKNDTAWFTLTNTSPKTLIFLPTFYNEDFRILLGSRSLATGESTRIGIVYYTEAKGRFNQDVPIYINLQGEPVHFYLKGNIKGFDPMAQLRCPVVNEGASKSDLEKVVTIEVRDRQTDVQLQPDGIKVENSRHKRVDLVHQGMEYKMSVSPGQFEVSVIKSGYDDYAALITLEPYQDRFVVYLDRKEEVITPSVVVVETPKDTATQSQEEQKENPDPVRKTDSTDVHRHPPPDPAPDPVPVPKPNPVDTVKTVKKEELDIKVYKLNNIILIVDVSASMNRDGKLDALKSSFNTMVDAFRVKDKVGVITMSSTAKVIQPPTNVNSRDSLKATVDGMKAAGGTNGGAALQLAYRLALENFVEDGNNQVIIATDGVFYGGSLSRGEMEKLISDGNKKGVHLSTVGFGDDAKALEFLQNLAKLGGGTFVSAGDGSDSDATLLSMIKAQSRK